MDVQGVISRLNYAVTLENTACIMYKQAALLVTGLHRKPYSDFFMAESLASHAHAVKFGQKIVALGGFPSVDIEYRACTHDLKLLLEMLLGIERKAVEAYSKALELARDNIALANMLEDQIDLEQQDVEELELMLQEQ